MNRKFIGADAESKIDTQRAASVDGSEGDKRNSLHEHPAPAAGVGSGNYRVVMHPFEALADPVRRRLIDILASGEHNSGELAAAIGVEFHISRTAVSKHLRLLRDAGFVGVRPDERWRYYHLTSDGFEVLERAIADIRRKWERRVGWNPETRRDFDSLAGFARPRAKSVPFRGPGRPRRKGMRGTQTEVAWPSDPDWGYYPLYLPPPETRLEA